MTRRIFVLCSTLVLLILITPAQAVNTDPVEPIGACYKGRARVTITQSDGTVDVSYHCLLGSGAFLGKVDCDPTPQGCEIGGPNSYQQIA